MKLLPLLTYAYLVGSIPTAYLLGRWIKGIDIRRYGTGNVGGSNLWNHVSRKWVLPMIAFEVAVKGMSPVLVGHYLLGFNWTSWPLAFAGLVAIAGHNWPVWLGFKGGRGVATALGPSAFLTSWPLALALSLVGLGWLFTRSSALWVGIGVVSLPLWTLALGHPAPHVGFAAGVTVLISAKRLLSNAPPPPDEPLARVILYRLLYDRDIRDAVEWKRRMPSTTGVTAETVKGGSAKP